MFSQVIGRHLLTTLLSEKGLVTYHGKFVQTILSAYCLLKKDGSCQIFFFFYPENQASFLFIQAFSSHLAIDSFLIFTLIGRHLTNPTEFCLSFH